MGLAGMCMAHEPGLPGATNYPGQSSRFQQCRALCSLLVTGITRHTPPQLMQQSCWVILSCVNCCCCFVCAGGKRHPCWHGESKERHHKVHHRHHGYLLSYCLHHHPADVYSLTGGRQRYRLTAVQADCSRGCSSTVAAVQPVVILSWVSEALVPSSGERAGSGCAQHSRCSAVWQAGFICHLLRQLMNVSFDRFYLQLLNNSPRAVFSHAEGVGSVLQGVVLGIVRFVL